MPPVLENQAEERIEERVEERVEERIEEEKEQVQESMVIKEEPRRSSPRVGTAAITSSSFLVSLSANWNQGY